MLGTAAIGRVYALATAADGSVLIGGSMVHRLGADGRITTVAGGGGSRAEGVPAVEAKVSAGGLAALQGGAFLLADPATNQVRRVSAEGVITTVAGNGTEGAAADGTPAIAAPLRLSDRVIGLLHQGDGGILFSEAANHRVRRVTPTGVLVTVAGTGDAGDRGDGGLATQAELLSPRGLAGLADGSTAIAEPYGLRIRRVAPDGAISTLSAFDRKRNPLLLAPHGLAIAQSGQLLVAAGGLLRLLPDGRATDALPAGSSFPWPFWIPHADFAGRAPQCSGPITVTHEGGVLLADTCSSDLWYLPPAETRWGFVAVRDVRSTRRSVSSVLETTQPGSVELRVRRRGRTVAVGREDAQAGRLTLSVAGRFEGWHELRATWTGRGRAVAVDRVDLFLGDRLPLSYVNREVKREGTVGEDPPTEPAGCRQMTIRRVDCQYREYGRRRPVGGRCAFVGANMLLRSGVILNRSYKCDSKDRRPYRLQPRWSEPALPFRTALNDP